MKFIESIKQGLLSPLGYKEILRVGLPLVVSMSSSTIMQFTDRIFLSKYSVESIAAAVPATVVSLTIVLTLMGICSYSTVLIAQYVGANRFNQVGSALWQGIWCSLVSSIILVSMYFLAEPIFSFANHEIAVQKLEVDYFRILTLGSIFCLLDATIGGFFSGQGKTRIVMIANMLAVIINIPLDYILIFGGFGIPSLGIKGAGIATACGWFFCFAFLSFFVFTRKNEEKFNVISGWRFSFSMFKRLVKYGFPSGINLFVELFGFTYFVFIVGRLGKVALAASNIVFSLNSIAFVPMLGLNIAVATLAGQAMGREQPTDVESITKYTLHIVSAYMIPIVIVFAIFPSFFINIFAPSNISADEFEPVLNLGSHLIYFISIYSFLDAANIVYFGALKGVGDTKGVMKILLSSMVFLLILPILAIEYFGYVNVYAYWIVFTIYVMLIAVAVHYRFWLKKWHSIRVIDN